MLDIGFISYFAGAVLFFLLVILLATGCRGKVPGLMLVVAVASTSVWAAVVAYHMIRGAPPYAVLNLFEVMRDLAWIVFLAHILGYTGRDGRIGGRRVGILFVVTGLTVVTTVLLPFTGLSVLGAANRMLLFFVSHILLAMIVLVLVEQLFRNTHPEQRWTIQYLCIGIGGMFAYEFFMYSDALLFERIDTDLWNARGAINGLVVPFIAVSVSRNPQWAVDLFVSRQVVFHSTALFGAGIYLMIMAAAGYYIREFGGTWGTVFQIMFLFGSIVLLVMLMYSDRFRARLRVELSKHFFTNKYDYRYEWLRVTKALSESERSEELYSNVVMTVAVTVESAGGLLWLRDSSGRFSCAANANIPWPDLNDECDGAEIAAFLRKSGWIIDVDEWRQVPDLYHGLVLPEWLLSTPQVWLVVPLFHHDDLLGFAVLVQPAVERRLNWEDMDLLKTVGRQVASYIAVFRLTEELAESRQFEAFNRLSAYVVHDLKNLIAQLSLVSTNAQKHMQNPEFMADAMTTVQYAVAKMNRLMEHLRTKKVPSSAAKSVNLATLLNKAVQALSASRPVPQLHLPDEEVEVLTEHDRLMAVIEHLVQNAQEATPDDGEVAVKLENREGKIRITIRDTGSGMDEDFIRNRLYKPFDTTKGNAGMGIGVYEAREFVNSQGGEISVSSQPGTGTTFVIHLSQYRKDTGAGLGDRPPMESAG